MLSSYQRVICVSIEKFVSVFVRCASRPRAIEMSFVPPKMLYRRKKQEAMVISSGDVCCFARSSRQHQNICSTHLLSDTPEWQKTHAMCGSEP